MAATFDAVANYRGITKWAANINQLERVPELIQDAVRNLTHKLGESFDISHWNTGDPFGPGRRLVL